MQTYTYEGSQEGAHLIVLGAIHGNEPRGTEALERVRSELDAGHLQIARGKLTLVPVANGPAYAKNARYLEEDLNRVFRKTGNPTSSEAHIANELTCFVDTADVLLDIHTTSAPGPSCVFIDFPTEANKALAQVVGAKFALLNWPELYEGSEAFDSFDTTRYAYEAGKDGIIVETGQHDEPEAADRAYEVIIRFLSHLQLIESRLPAESIPKLRSIRMTHLYQKEAEDDHFCERWNHLERIPANTVIAKRKDGTEIRMDQDCMMLLPKHHAQPGQEWFYLGIEV